MRSILFLINDDKSRVKHHREVWIFVSFSASTSTEITGAYSLFREPFFILRRRVAECFLWSGNCSPLTSFFFFFCGISLVRHGPHWFFLQFFIIGYNEWFFKTWLNKIRSLLSIFPHNRKVWNCSLHCNQCYP